MARIAREIQNGIRPYTPNFDDEVSYGIEIEFVAKTVEDETRNMSTDEYKEFLANKIFEAGEPCIVNSYTGRQYDKWQLKYDCSVELTDEQLTSKYNGTKHWDTLEMVSPVLKGRDGLKRIEKVLNIMKKHGAMINESCGTHIHVSVNDLFTLNSIATPSNQRMRLTEAIDVFADFEPVMEFFVPLKRRSNKNSYCLQVQRGTMYEENVRTYTKRNQHVFDYSTASAIVNRHSKINPRNVSAINKNTFEFRMFEGCLDINRIKHWVWLCQKLTHKAVWTGGVHKQCRNDKGRNLNALFGYLRCDRDAWGRNKETIESIDFFRKEFKRNTRKVKKSIISKEQKNNQQIVVGKIERTDCQQRFVDSKIFMHCEESEVCNFNN